MCMCACVCACVCETDSSAGTPVKEGIIMPLTYSDYSITTTTPSNLNNPSQNLWIIISMSCAMECKCWPFCGLKCFFFFAYCFAANPADPSYLIPIVITLRPATGCCTVYHPTEETQASNPTTQPTMAWRTNVAMRSARMTFARDKKLP